MKQETEFERQFRVLDQMISMHSTLRDKYKWKALMLSCFLLTAAVILNGCVFIDDKTLLELHCSPTLSKIILNFTSIIILVISIIELRVDWGGCAHGHGKAVEKLSKLKAKYRESISKSETSAVSGNQEITTEYSQILLETPPVPEAVFTKLKAKHLSKKMLSDLISQHPGAPLWLLELGVKWKAIKTLVKEGFKEHSGSCHER